MIVVGAKGFAKQIIEILYQKDIKENLFFFDNISEISDQFYNHEILKNFESVSKIFSDGSKEFSLGIGGPHVRKKLASEFINLGGELTSIISPFAFIGNYAMIKKGVSISTGAVVENDAEVGEGCLINTHVSIHHEVRLGAYSEVAPGARLLGACMIDEEVFIGSNAVILPSIKVGKGAVIGAGAVVIEDVQPFSMVVGNPAKHIRYVHEG